MKQINLTILLTVLVSMLSTKTFAYDVAVENEDGKTICYNYINNSTELEVTYYDYDDYYNRIFYSGDIKIPETVTILNKTRKVTRIGNLAFQYCLYLTSITFPSSVTSIGEGAFYNCGGLTSITIPSSMTSIDNYTFYYCSGLTSITIPSSVTSIGNNAFYYCSGLTSITIPSSVTSIGNNAFNGCSGLTSVTIPSSVTSIGSSAFRDCKGLTSVTIPSSVTSISSLAFSGCSGLTSVTIPSNVTSIGNEAFYGCSGLTSVTIPSSVTSIDDRAFDGCNNLADFVSLIEDPFKVSNIVSNFIYNNGTLYVPEGTIEKYKATDGWKQFVWIEEGMPTGIESVKGNAINGNNVYYDFNGNRLDAPKKGLNIINGKKVIVK